MQTFNGTFQKYVTFEVHFDTYRTEAGAHLVVRLEGRSIPVELDDGEARGLGQALIAISKEASDASHS